MATEVEKFGRDHLSLMRFVEDCCVERNGRLVDESIRGNQLREDGDTHPTRLRDGSTLAGHNDLDCLEDLEEAGWVENRGSGIYPLCRLTDAGWRVAGFLRRRRAEHDREAIPPLAELMRVHLEEPLKVRTGVQA